jgi:site-specific recombinase XerC
VGSGYEGVAAPEWSGGNVSTPRESRRGTTAETGGRQGRSHQRNPHQLWYNYATNVSRELGLKAAPVLLGHTTTDVTQIYAVRGMDLAATMAAKVG